MALNDSKNLLSSWNPSSVNPCFGWSNIICNSDYNVTSMNLASMGFTGVLSHRIGELPFLNTVALQDNHISGTLPSELGNMVSLQSLNLENNNITGDIPSSLGQLPDLQYLIIRNNKLGGEIPPSIAGIPNLIELDISSNNLTGKIPEAIFKVAKYNFTGNNLNCGSSFQHPCASTLYSNSGYPKSKLGVLTGGLGAAVVILTFFLFLLWKSRMWCSRRDVFVDVSGEHDRKIAFGQLRRFSWRELQLATDNFSEKNLLGQGGFSKVYKGVLGDNTKVAVKRLTDYNSLRGEATFLREVEMISVAVHRNILRLIGFCISSSERLLVYPYMENLSVAYRLREIKPGETGLDWPTRKRVAFGAACGLEYLHDHSNPKIIHRDLKASNILLNEDFEAVVGDFGLAMLVDAKKSHITTQVRGTMGHIAPEYLSTGRSSEKTDVFAYGIMLLELVTGRRAIDFSRLEEDDQVLLLSHVEKLQREKRIDVIVDRNLMQNYDPEEVEAIIQIALLCTQTSPEDRPKMTKVVRMLEGEGLAELWEEWNRQQVSYRKEHELMPRRFAESGSVFSAPLLSDAWELSCSVYKSQHVNRSYVRSVITGSKLVVFAFRGSLEPNSATKYGEYQIKPQDGFLEGMKDGNDQRPSVHQGALSQFQEIWSRSGVQKEVSEDYEKGNTIVFTGHSMGGGIAALATLRMLEMQPGLPKSVFCITFGFPLIGDEILARGVRRKKWADQFCHVVLRRDALSRILLVPSISVSKPLEALLPYWNRSMQSAADSMGSTDSPMAETLPGGIPEFVATVVQHCSAVSNYTSAAKMSPNNPLIAAVKPLVKLSPYRPFGYYLFCSSNGAILTENHYAVLPILYFSLQTLGANLEDFILQHVGYGYILPNALQNIVKFNELSDLPLSDAGSVYQDARIKTQLDALGLGIQNCQARLALRAAGQLRYSRA